MKINRITILRLFKQYYKAFWPSMIILILSSMLAVPVSLSSPKLFQLLIDDVILKKNIFLLKFIVIGLIFIYIAKLALDSINLYFNNKTLNGFTLKIRIDLWNKIFRSPYSNIEKREIGDLKMRFIDDVDVVSGFVKEQIVDYVYNVILAIISLVFMCTINYKMVISCIWVIPCIFFINHLIAKGNKKVNEEIRKTNQEYYSSTYNSLQLWREIKIHCAENAFIRKFQKYRDKLAVLGFKSIHYWFYNEAFNDFKSNYLSKVMVYIIGTLFIFNNEITIGNVIMFGEIFELMFNSMDAINIRNSSIKTNMPYYKRIIDTLNFEEEQYTGNMSAFNDNINIQIDSFQYNKHSNIILKNVNFKIKKGDFLTIVGRSGAGKTSFIKILLGLYKSTNQVGDDSIKYDGMSMSEINKDELYKKVGVVMQDNFLFNTSIRENIIMSNTNASESDLVKACQASNILEFILSLPDKFDTVVGERGIKLSGGQKQRICIARTLIKKPDILIFDEATSSVDNISENIIYESLQNISDQTTIIIVTHKPSAILHSPYIVRIDEGHLSITECAQNK